MTKFIQFSHSWLTPTLILGFFFINSLQDLLEAGTRGFHFYPSESLLFGSYYLWFFPGLVIIHILRHKRGKRGLVVFTFIIFLLHMLAYALGIHLISGLMFEGPYPFRKTLFYALSNYSILGLLIYGILLYHLFRQTPLKKRDQSGTIPIKIGKQILPLVIDEILYIKSEKPYIRIYTKERSYLANLSLKSIIQDLGDEHFIRVHKSSILNLRYLHSISSRNNGDYDIHLKEGSLLRLSRHYAAPLKAYLKGSTT